MSGSYLGHPVTFKSWLPFSESPNAATSPEGSGYTLTLTWHFQGRPAIPARKALKAFYWFGPVVRAARAAEPARAPSDYPATFEQRNGEDWEDHRGRPVVEALRHQRLGFVEGVNLADALDDVTRKIRAGRLDHLKGAPHGKEVKRPTSAQQAIREAQE